MSYARGLNRLLSKTKSQLTFPLSASIPLSQFALLVRESNWVGAFLNVLLNSFLTVWILLQASTTNIPENDPERVCTHGIPLAGVNGDPCALCERPGSRGGQVIADLEALHWEHSKRQRAKRLGKKNRGTDCGNAPRQFAERHQNDNF